jgi:trans-aconitate 2-methyltransferase
MTTNNKSYAWDAKDYAKNSTNQFQWAQELIPKLELQDNETLLDIGCGDGKITAELAKALPKGKVVGIDSSEQMIKLAKNAFPAQDYANLSFQVMDARKLSFKEEFDRVFSNAALHWIVDQKPVLEGIARSLKPKGFALLQMGGKGNAKDMLAVLEAMLQEDKWRRYFEGFTFPYSFCDPIEYSVMLLEAGLLPNRVELLPKVMKLAGAEGLAGWVRTTWLPYTERLPADLKEAFIYEMVRLYVTKHPLDSQGSVCMDMVRLEAKATKTSEQ